MVGINEDGDDDDVAVELSFSFLISRSRLAWLAGSSGGWVGGWMVLFL